MLKDITIGQYVKGDSVLHRLDPRTKIFGMLAIMVALFFVNNWIGLLYAAVVVFAVLFASQVPLKFYIRGVKPLRWILLFTAAIQIFLTPGEIIWQWGILHITAEGVRLAIFMCVRLVLLVMTTSVLTLTTTPIVLTDAVENLLSPFKRIGVPAHELAMMMTIALRFIPRTHGSRAGASADPRTTFSFGDQSRQRVGDGHGSALLPRRRRPHAAARAAL